MSLRIIEGEFKPPSGYSSRISLFGRIKYAVTSLPLGSLRRYAAGSTPVSASTGESIIIPDSAGTSRSQTLLSGSPASLPTSPARERTRSSTTARTARPGGAGSAGRGSHQQTGKSSSLLKTSRHQAYSGAPGTLGGRGAQAAPRAFREGLRALCRLRSLAGRCPPRDRGRVMSSPGYRGQCASDEGSRFPIRSCWCVDPSGSRGYDVFRC